MPRPVKPYVQDAATGASVTREFVERYLEQVTGPVRDTVTGAIHPSILDRIYGASPVPQEVLYKIKSRNPTKRYIGRAAKVTAGKNPDEFLWCVKADIGIACRLLNERARIILGYKYIADESDDEIALRLGIAPRTVAAVVRNALDKLTAILDRQ